MYKLFHFGVTVSQNLLLGCKHLFLCEMTLYSGIGTQLAHCMHMSGVRHNETVNQSEELRK